MPTELGLREAERPFDLVIFDWDGTLLDSVASIVECTLVTLEELGVSGASAETVRSLIGLGIRESVETLCPGCDEALFRRVVEVYRRHWIDTYHQHPVLFAGVPETLATLSAAGYLLAVATAKGRSGLDRDLQRTGLEGLFATSRTVDEAASKPAPDMLLQILDELGVCSKRALMVGDSVHDLEMARNARVPAVGVASGSQPETVLRRRAPLACLPHVRALPAWLARRRVP